MAGLAEVTTVAIGDERRDHLALGARERIGAAKQNLGELAHRLRCFRSKREPAGDSRESVGKGYVWHGFERPIIAALRKGLNTAIELLDELC
jgi:hypothetical protein